MVRGLVRFLNNSSLLVAFAAAALTTESFFLSGTSIRVWVVVEIFFITWCGYVFLRRKERTPYQKPLIYISVTGSIICFFLTDFFGWPVLLTSGIIVLVYNFSSLNTLKLEQFIPRQITFLKPAVVGIAWALTTSVWPAYFGTAQESYYYLLFLSNFFFITALAICDDIRDMNRDTGNTKTLPLAIGLKPTRIIVIIHLLIATMLFCLTNKYQTERITNGYVVSMIGIALVTINIRPQGNYHIQALMIDGSILLRAIVIALLSLSF